MNQPRLRQGGDTASAFSNVPHPSCPGAIIAKGASILLAAPMRGSAEQALGVASPSLQCETGHLQWQSCGAGSATKIPVSSYNAEATRIGELSSPQGATGHVWNMRRRLALPLNFACWKNYLSSSECNFCPNRLYNCQWPVSNVSFRSERLPPPLPSFLRVVCIVRGMLCPGLPATYILAWGTFTVKLGSLRPRVPTSQGNFQGPGRRKCVHMIIRFSKICKGQIFKLQWVKPAVYFQSVFPSTTLFLCWVVLEWLRTFLEMAKGKLHRGFI